MLAVNFPEYLNSKNVKTGIKNPDPVFVDLITWLNKQYGGTVINAMYDEIGSNGWPQLKIIVERHEDVQKFKDALGHSFDPIIQKEIGSYFIGLLRRHKKLSFNQKVFFWVRPKLAVMFLDFSKYARGEAMQNVRPEKVNEVIRKYKQGEIWEIHRQDICLSVFFL